MNVTKSKGMQRQSVRRSLCITIFHKLSVVYLVFMTVLSSVVGSAPFRDSSHDA